MFNQRTKSMRSKASDDTLTASANPTTPNTLTAPPKGLLSFNTSNFTKLFKNSTNFVQSTFGSGNSTSQSPASHSGNHNSSAVLTEQSFTIPSIKNRNDASHASKKQQRDILSTPILIQPVSMTNTTSANLSSYKNVSNDDCKSKIKAMPKALAANGAHIQSSTATAAASPLTTTTSIPVANITVTISTASNQTPSSLLHARNLLANNEMTTSATNKQHIETQQKLPPNTIDAKLQNPQNVSDENNTLTLTQPTRSSAAKKINANMLFETVKMGKQKTTVNGTSTPSTPTQAASQPSSIISFDGSTENGKNSTISGSNHIKCCIATKTNMDKNYQSEQSAYEKIPSNRNVMDNELKDVQHMENNRENIKVILSNNRMNVISMNVSPSQISSESTPFLASDSTKTFDIMATTNNIHPSTQCQKYYNQINDNGMNVLTPTKNNNLFEYDELNNGNVSRKTNMTCNNDLDHNLDECIRRTNNTNDNPFKMTTMTTTAIKCTATDVDLLTTHATDNSKTVENIYANCVMMPMKSANSDNNQQQDTNENVIADNEMDVLGGINVADGPNNNYSNVNFKNGDSLNVCNNNASIQIDQQKISNDNNDDDNGATAVKIITNTTSDSTTKMIQNVSQPSTLNQNCLTPKTYEMYDILEESDDDEHSNIFRFNRWNSSCSLFVPKTNVSLSSSSYAAAIAFAHEMDSTNRNPFLQLITVSPATTTVASQTITTTSTKSPIVITGSFDTQSYAERQKNSIGIAAPLISSTFNNNDQSDDVRMAFTSSGNCLTSNTLSISNCANAWNDFNMQAIPTTPTSPPPSPPLPSPPSSSSFCSSSLLPHLIESQSSSQLNGFIEQNDFQLNANSNLTAPAKNHISSDVMDAMLLFLKEHGNQYIRQFMQVI